MPELVIAEWNNYYRTIIAQRYQSLFSHLHRAPELVKFPRSSWWSSCSFSSIAPFSASWGWTWDRGALSGRYPLVMTNIAIENGHRNNWCTRIHSKWWFTIVMLVYQRVMNESWWACFFNLRMKIGGGQPYHCSIQPNLGWDSLIESRSLNQVSTIKLSYIIREPTQPTKHKP